MKKNGVTQDGGKKLADYALFFDLFSSIGVSRNEKEVVDGIAAVFHTICTPAYVAYLPFYGGISGPLKCRPRQAAEQETGIAERLAGFGNGDAWTASGKGFIIRISYAGEKLGVIEVEGMAFPEYREHYLNLALNSAAVLGLAISNARNYHALEEKNDELANSERRFHILSDASFEGILINIEGKVVDCNTAFAHMFGYEPEEIIGTVPLGLYPPESQAVLLDHIRRGSEEVYDVAGIKKDGTPIFVEVRGRNITYHGQKARITAVRDITARKAMEESLRNSETRFRLLVESSPFCIHEIGRDGKILSMNKAGLDMLGLKEEKEVCGMPYLGSVCKGDKDRIDALMQAAFNGTVNHFEFDSGGDAPRRFKSCFVPIRGGDGAVIKLMGVTEDITERKAAEQAIRESEGRYRQLSEASFEGIVIAVDGNIMDTNGAFARMFGYTREEIIGKTPLNLSPPESHAIIMDHIRRGSDEVYDTIGLKKDGTLFPMEIQGRVIVYRGQKARLTAIRDITERKRHEELLRESEQKFVRFFTMLPIALGVVSKDGVITHFNARFTEAFGYTVDDMPTIKEWWERAYPDESYRRWVLDTWGNAVDKAAKEGTDIESIEYKVTCKNGAERFVMIGGILLNGDVLATFVDITEKKKAEEALRASEQRFRAVAQSAADAIISINAAGEVIHWNKGAERMFGYSESEMRGKPGELLIPKRHDEAHRRGLARVVAGEPYRLVGKTAILEGVRKDGSEFPLELSLAAWEEGGKTYFTGIIRDTTERKAAEEALRKSNQLFDAIIENIPNMIFLKRASDLRFELFNRAGETLLGHGRNELLGRNDYDFFPKEQADFFVNKDRETLEKNDITDVPEEPIETPSGTRILHTKKLALRDEHGQPQYLLGISEDITDHKAAERAVHQMSLFPKFNPGPIIRCDANGLIQMANPAALAVFETDKLEGVKVQEVIPGLGNIDLASIIRDDLLINYTAVLNKGCFQFAIKGVAELRVLNIYGSDITARKAAEEKLKAAKEAAEEATRMKDKFVSLVSHDLKTPLSSMIGFLKLVRNDYAEPLSDGAKLILDRAAESGQTMIRLIEDLLTISRFKTGQLKLDRQFFDAEYLGVMIAANYSHLAAQKGIELENTIPVNSRIYGDKTLLTEAVQNLVTNAIKFCKSGDRITISAAAGVPPVICVRDTGPGIQPNLLADLFRFEKKTSTTGTAGEIGTGFGLPLVKEIMQLHGGELSVESEPGKGCLFSLKLPYMRPKVLLVDDDRHVRLLQIMQLRELGADIIEAENGQDALNMLTVIRPDLVITDIQMPVMGGLELLKRIKGAPETKDIPVIVMSGEFGMEIRDTIFKFGGDDFVTKKIDKADFFPRVRRFIG